MKKIIMLCLAIVAFTVAACSITKPADSNRLKVGEVSGTVKGYATASVNVDGYITGKVIDKIDLEVLLDAYAPLGVSDAAHPLKGINLQSFILKALGIDTSEAYNIAVDLTVTIIGEKAFQFTKTFTNVPAPAH